MIKQTEYYRKLIKYSNVFYLGYEFCKCFGIYRLWQEVDQGFRFRIVQISEYVEEKPAQKNKISIYLILNPWLHIYKVGVK